MSRSEVKKEVSAPKWLDKKFLEKCVQTSSNNCHIEVNEFTVEPATKAGDNYGSEMYRVEIVFTELANENEQRPIEKKIKFVIKAEISDKNANKAISKLNISHREMEMYDNIVPKMNAMLNDLNIEAPIFANKILTSQENGAIVFEDLRTLGYQLKGASVGFDLNEAKNVLQKLAQFHGTCAKLNEQQLIFEAVKEGLISPNSNVLELMFTTFLQALIERVTQWHGFEQITEKLRALKPKLYGQISKVFEVRDNRFNTLLHADPWINNIMVKFNDESKIENALLIDLQTCCWGASVNDVHYFFGTSLTDELQLDEDAKMELLRFYHNELASILKRLKYQKPIPTFDEISAQFKSSIIYGFAMTCCIHPAVLGEPHKDASSECFLTDSETARTVKRSIFETQRNQDNLKKLLPLYESLGVFD